MQLTLNITDRMAEALKAMSDQSGDSVETEALVLLASAIAEKKTKEKYGN